MSKISKILLVGVFLSSIGFAANVNVTTKYGKTGGIVGPLNKTTDKVNGREICPADPTAGCDFDDDPKFNNNNTVDDPTDDTYSGDLLVRTNDNFQAIAGWTWTGVSGGTDEVATLTGTLPETNGKHYYEWTELPGSCDPAQSSISADKQTIICVRKDFDKNDAGTFSEDLTFNVRVLGKTPSGTQPGDIKFKVEAPNATAKEDTTDGNSLTVTAAPRWNLDKSYTYIVPGDSDPDDANKKGWRMNYKFYIESDEVSGETDNVNPAVGNESMGDDATFEFDDDISGLPAGSKLVGCTMDGRHEPSGYQRTDGLYAGNDPIACYGAGCIKGPNELNGDEPARHIMRPKGQQTVTCSQNGNMIHIKVEHVDATLDHYPTKDYYGNDLPKNRAIAAIGGLDIFIPLEGVKNGLDGQPNTNDDGEFPTKNKMTNFDPTTPTGNSNFGNATESEKDNIYNATLYYASGGWDKYYRGSKFGLYGDNVWSYVGASYRSGDGMVNAHTEFSTLLDSTNTGGTPQTEDSFCDVIDAYRMKIKATGENQYYTNIKTRYQGKPELPYRFLIENDDGNYTDNNGADGFPYVVEYATGYVDDSFLPSKGGDTNADVGDKIITECTDNSVQWTTDFDSVKDANGGLGVTKVRFRLKPGYEHPPGSTLYIWLNHEVRSTDLATNNAMRNGDLIVNYATHKFNDKPWSKTTYKPGTFPGNHSGTAGDRVIFTGPKVRIKKAESRSSAALGDEVTYTLAMSYTNDTGLDDSGEVRVVDVMPKDFKYKQGSVDPSSFGEPTIGDCNDVTDTNTPCVNGENQVLIWDLGTIPVNAPEIPDLNYTALIGAAANVGTNTNVVKIESPTDASPISQRKADIGLSIDVPSSINIVKNTEKNDNYPSKRERTTDPKDIFFLMDIRNGKNGDVTDLDVIDILPFKGDGDNEAIKFNDLKLKRKVPTDYHGTMVFHKASFGEHPLSPSACDYNDNGKLDYYYTNADPKTINMAPTVGDANDVTSNSSIWCQGDENGPNGCTIPATNFTFSNNSEVTAVRARGPKMDKQAICQFRVHVTVDDNLAGDNYSNSAGASATGITLPVLSNSLAVPVVGSSLGDFVWYDKNKDGKQDAGEKGIAGVKVHLLDTAGNPVNDPTTGQPYVVTTDANGKYSFSKLNHGDYQVKFVPPAGYNISPKGATGDAEDSDADPASGAALVTLGVDEHNPKIDMGLYTPGISGHVFDDGNGDGNVNGTAIDKPDGTQLYATLLAADGTTVLASKPIAADGTYEFDGADGIRINTNYKVVISTAQNATTSTLPANWNNTGQQPNNGGNGNDGTNDGILSVGVKTKDMPNNDFGINKKPTAVNKNKPSEINPGGNTQVSVPTLEKQDKEDGNATPSKIKITQLPTNATLYYNGQAVTAGQTIDNYDPAKLTLDPNDGALKAEFKYTVFDNDGQESDPATVTMPFTDLEISGHLFNDGNGDGNINGTTIYNPGGTQLNAILVDANGNVVATTPIANDGTYSFNTADGVTANTDYKLVLSTAAGTAGQPAPAAQLPSNWNNADGEKPSNDQNNGNDGTADGQMNIHIGTQNLPNNDFGINHKPVANDTSKPSQLNPGGTTQVQVPDLNVTDTEDGKPTTLTIKDLPKNATLYYNGQPVTAGQVIPNYDPTNLTVDPTDGEQTVVFHYTTTDKAGVESNLATVTMPFTGLQLSGHVYNDGNGNGNIDGTAISKPNGIPIYANLLDTNGTVLASTPITVNGTYTFTGADGVTANTSYKVELSTAAGTIGQPAQGASLPAKWNNADGEQPNNPGTGTDGKADGLIYVTVGTVNAPNNDFGINHKPVSSNVSKPIQDNPGGDTQVPVPPLPVNDKEDGKPTTVTIKTLPNSGTLYYNGTPVTAGQVIPHFDPSKLTVDPKDGNVKVIFTYTTTDRAGVESASATVTMPFNVDGSITGNVSERTSSGTHRPIAHVTLVLYTPNGQEVSRTRTDKNGNYKFTTIPPGNYYIQEAQPKGYYDVSEKEGGADHEPANLLINTINVTVAVGETDTQNNFVESKIKYGCIHNPTVPCSICMNGDKKVYAYAEQLDTNTAKLYWSDTHDEIAYDIYVNGIFVASVGKNVTSYTLKKLQSDAPYSVAIVARNAAGGVTAQTVVLKTLKVNAGVWLPAIYNLLLP